jgi:hypothetical protein
MDASSLVESSVTGAIAPDCGLAAAGNPIPSINAPASDRLAELPLYGVAEISCAPGGPQG